MSADDPNEQAGMTSQAEWQQTDVHKHSKYFCAKCGKRFPNPQILYDHLDSEHADD